MPTSQLALVAANVAAILILVFGLYVPRHRRRDLVVACLAINIGVLAIASVLSTVEVSVGLGIGLFGVLSIIRLRSDELDQREVAYYFAALALGLLGGIRVVEPGPSLALMGGLLAAMWLGDHPRLLGRYRVQELTLDRAWIDERQLEAHLADVLGGTIHRVLVRRVDFVNDTTTVEVRFETGRTAPEPVREAPGAELSGRLAS
jgi:hypothetical protein